MLKVLPVVHGVEVITCSGIRDNVYLCNTEVDATIDDIRASRPVEITIAKKNNGSWTNIQRLLHTFVPLPALGFRGTPIFVDILSLRYSADLYASLSFGRSAVGTTQSAMT